MSRGLAFILINVTFFMPMGSALGQTSEQINNLLKGSKLVATGREVKATVAPDETKISTFCDAQASDQDCKITALLMMKELRQHYKSIHRIRVFFYNPDNSGRSKDVEIREADVALVDAGNPVKDVLAEIGITNHIPRTRAAVTAVTAAHAAAGRHTRSVASPSSSTTQGEFVRSTSADGAVSINYPRDWQVDPSEAGVALAKAFTKTKEGKITLTFYRNAVPAGMTLDGIVNLHEAQAQAIYPGYKRIGRSDQKCAGLPGIYLEAAATAPNGLLTTERSEFMHDQSHFYGLTIYSYGYSDDYMNSLFNTISNSIRIRS